jgi:glycosyltransferase involved in cell wall biosynthesis
VKGRLRILYYHNIAVAPPGAALAKLYVTPDDFARQMACLKRLGLCGVSIGEGLWHLARHRADRVIALTFDDGYADNLHYAAPILHEYRFGATCLWPETFGRVAAEAQACGVPVIVSAAGGLVEALIPGRTGLLLDSPVDSASLCTAIESFTRDAILRARLGAAGINFVRSRFGAEQIAAAFIRNLRTAPFALPAWEPLPESSTGGAEEPQAVHPAVAPSMSLGN